MKKLTKQNSELVQKWMEVVTNDLSAQEIQMAERLNEQRIDHQSEVEEFQATIASLKEELKVQSAKSSEQSVAQVKEIEKLKVDGTNAVRALRAEMSRMQKTHEDIVREMQAEVNQLKSDQSKIHAELRNQINQSIEISQENEEIEALLNQVSTELATKNIEINETQVWIDHMAALNQKLEKQIADERAVTVELKAKLASSYQKVLSEQSKNLAFTERLKRQEKTSNEIPKEAVEAIETSQRLKAMVEEERKVFDEVTKELNRRIAMLETEREYALKIIEEVKSVSSVEEVTARIKRFETIRSNLS